VVSLELAQRDVDDTLDQMITKALAAPNLRYAIGDLARELLTVGRVVGAATFPADLGWMLEALGGCGC
jgi:hypothetical protein